MTLGEPSGTRVVEWHDPLATAEVGRGLAGIDFLQAMIDGEVPPPPIAKLMNMRMVSVATGTATFQLDPDESQYNPLGIVHGGVVCTLLDTVLGCAVHTTLPAGQGYTSLEIKVSYLRAVTQTSGPLTAVGRVTRPGSRAAFAEGTVHDRDGKLVATASSTLLVFPL